MWRGSGSNGQGHVFIYTSHLVHKMWRLRPRASEEFGFLRGLIYIPVVSKRSPRSKLFEWRVTRIQASPARFIGYVEAPDAKQAIRAAIRRSGLQRD
jgi:hypothetical protein